MTSFRHLVNAAWMTAALFFSCSASAVYQEIDAIVAVVEEDVVLASELKSRYDQVVRQMKEQKM